MVHLQFLHGEGLLAVLADLPLLRVQHRLSLRGQLLPYGAQDGEDGLPCRVGDSFSLLFKACSQAFVERSDSLSVRADSMNGTDPLYAAVLARKSVGKLSDVPYASKTHFGVAGGS